VGQRVDADGLAGLHAEDGILVDGEPPPVEVVGGRGDEVVGFGGLGGGLVGGCSLFGRLVGRCGTGCGDEDARQERGEESGPREPQCLVSAGWTIGGHACTSCCRSG